MTTKELDLNAIARTLEEDVPDLQAIYLFGSRASGQMHSGSDVDLGVLAKKPLSQVERFELACKLGAILNEDVDLVDLRSASPVLAVQVIGKGKLIFCYDKNADDVFGMYALSDYARLNEERWEILEMGIAREG